MIEVTIIRNDGGAKTEILTEKEFYKQFGKNEGKEILAGYLPQIVAVVI